ncbi:MAG: DUF7482 domain-containing protein [Nitrosotalea sp.]
MNRFLIAVIIAAVAGVIFSIPLISDHLASAGTVKKIQFTQTLTSSQDPGQGHSSEQLVMILAPNNGTLYDGTLTYTASEPVQIVILHKIDQSDSKGQPVWTVDNNTIYAETILNSDSNGGTLDFAGSAIGLHSTNSSQFTATATVDGWIRGATPELFQNNTQMISVNNLKLSRAEIPVNIPLHEGFFNGKPIYYIITDSSDSTEASVISSKQNWKVQESPPLAQAPEKLLGKVYVFTNGISGNGTKGFQNEVFSDTPSDSNYTPISLIVQATWTAGRTPQVLNSTQDILNANATSKLTLTTTNTAMNMPQVVWPSGQMSIRDNKELSDQTAYAKGQVLNIDTVNKFVTFVAHRGWGPDGKTIYYIITSGTPEGPAKMMGLMNTPALSLFSPISRDLYHFSNGINGGGPFGFQEGISGAQLGDISYSPICKVSMITWEDPTNARLLENINDINFEKSQGRITVQPALVYNNNYMIDCPIIEIPKSSS